jgi:hypothetical protein
VWRGVDFSDKLYILLVIFLYMNSMLDYIIDMDRLGLIEDCANYMTSSKGEKMVFGAFREDIEDNIGNWVSRSFSMIGSKDSIDQKEFLMATMNSLYCHDNILNWAKRNGDETYTDPQVYLATVAVQIKNEAKKAGLIKQTGSLLSLVA